MPAKKKEAAPQPPVSVEANIDMTVIEPEHVYGGQLGSVIATDVVNGKFVRYAHAYLTESGPEMTLDGKIAGKVTFEKLERIQQILALFKQQIEAFYAARKAS